MPAPGICIVCSKDGKIYAKQTCHKCYARANRLLHIDARRAEDRARSKTPRRMQQDRDRHQRHKAKRNALCRSYRAKHLEELREYDRARWLTPERQQAAQEYRANNIEHIRKIDRNEYYRNKDRHIARVMARRGHQGKATPKWLTKEQLQEISDLYKNRPPGYHVDHIVPLQGDAVCGLHVPWNLQYLPATENLKKGNRFGDY